MWGVIFSEMEKRPSQLSTQLLQLRKENLKNFRLVFKPLTSAIPVQRSNPEHRYRRGQGFECRTSRNFFQVFFSQLLKLRL